MRGRRVAAGRRSSSEASIPRSSVLDHDWHEDRSSYNTACVLACGASRADAVARAKPTLDVYEGFGCRYTGTIRGPLFQLKQLELGLER